MRAITFHGKQELHYETIADPTILAATDVILKTHCAGICGSDLHVYHEREAGLEHSTVMGHEVVGEIVALGRDVHHFKTGDLVFSPFTTNCGECFYCKIGLTARCEKGQLLGWRQNGVGLHGAQAEYVRIPLAEATLLRVPEEIHAEEALLLGDILSTGYFCAERAEINPRGMYAIIGCGPVGLMAICAARELGAERIFAIDSVTERLQLAERFGAEPVHLNENNAIASIRNATLGRGVDAALEVVGSPSAQRLAMDLVRPGGIISVVGVHTTPHFAFSPAEAYDKNITYKVGRCPARYYMERLLGLVRQQKYDFRSVISHRMPLAQGVEGYKIFDQKLAGCTKVVLWP